jgi:photosystem II stability/assembly factor-like uncharacterized protein
VDEVSGVCGLLKPAAHPEPAKNKSAIESRHLAIETRGLLLSTWGPGRVGWLYRATLL